MAETLDIRWRQRFFGIISDERWLNSITDRNITSHAYDETEAGIIYDNVMDVYIPLFVAFEKYMIENAR